MKQFFWFCALVTAFSIAAPAQDGKAEIFAGYSYMRADIVGLGFNFNGGSAAVAYNPRPWLGVVGDIGGYHTGSHGVDVTELTYLFGPRFVLSSRGRLTPFVQALFGVAHANVNFSGAPGTENAFAMAAGGGVDAVLTPRVSLRLAQAEYLMTRFTDGVNDRQNAYRISTGVVVRF